jgi:hypothetical protein
MKKLLSGIIIFITIVVLGIGGILLSIKPDELINEHKGEITVAIQENIGRELTLGQIQSSIFPTLGATISNSVLAGGTSDSSAQVELGKIEVKISLKKAILSFGKIIEIESLVLHDLTLRLARDKNGVWDFQDVLDFVATKSPSAPESTKPAETGPADLSILEDAVLSRVAIENARIEIDDQMLGRPLAVDKLFIETRDIRLGSPIQVSLSATLEDGNGRTPLSFKGKVSELRKDLSFDPVPDTQVEIFIENFDVAPWGALLPKKDLAPSSGKMSLDLKAHATAGLTQFTTDGKLRLEEFVLRESKTRGKPLSLQVDLKASANTENPHYQIQALNVKGTGINLNGTLLAKGLSPAGLKNANIKLQVQDLERIVQVIPAKSPLLPKELTLKGPVRAHVNGNASNVDIVLNLDQALVRWADVFHKRKDRPLNLKLEGKQKSNRLEIPQFELVVDAAKLKGTLSLPTDPKAPFAANISSGPIPFRSLNQLLPPIAAALKKGDQIDGTVEISAKAKVAGDKQDAFASVKLAKLDLNLDNLQAKGGGFLQASVVPKGTNTRIQAKGNFKDLQLKSKDERGQNLLNKPAGMPLKIDLDVNHTPQAATVHSASILFGKTVVEAKGGARKLDTNDPVLDLDFGQVDVDFNDVRRTVPGAAQLPAGGQLLANVKVKGSPSSLRSLKIDVKSLNLAFGKTKIRGDIRVSNLDAPVLDVSLPEIKIAFADIRPFDPSLDVLPADGRFAGQANFKGNTKRLSTIKADISIDELRYGKAKIKGTLGLENLDRPNFHFAIKSPYLNIDELLGEDDPNAKESEKAKEEKTGGNPHGLEANVRRQLAKVSGKGSLDIGRADFNDMTFRNFKGALTMKNGKVKFQALDFDIYGGHISAAGSTFNLPARYTEYALKLSTQNIQIGQALDAHTSMGKVMTGALNQKLTLSGRGLSGDDLKKSLDGSVRFSTKSLTIKSLDLLGPIGAPVDKALKKAGNLFGQYEGFSAASAQTQSASSGLKGTTLKNIEAFLDFNKGRFKLKKPIKAQTHFGALSLSGGGALDNTVDLKATASLSPSTVNKAMGRKAVSKSVDVPLHIGGTFDKPKITGVDTKTLIQSVLGGQAAAALDDLKNQAEAEARALAERAKKEAQRAEERAQRELEKAKNLSVREAKKAQEKAQREAERAQKKAEREAAKAKRKAEREAQKAKKKAEREAKKLQKEAEKQKRAAERAAKKEMEKLKDQAEDAAKDAIKNIGGNLGL